MAVLKMIWQDIRRGENIDSYANIVIAFVVAVLGAIGVAPPPLVASLNLLVLGVLAWSSLVNRHKLEEGSKSIDDVLLTEYPASLAADIDRAHSLWILGTNLSSTIPNLYTLLEKKLRRGTRIKVGVVTPFSEASKLAAMRMYRPVTEERHNSMIWETLQLLQSLAQIDNGDLEIRTIDYPVHQGFFGINLDSADAVLYVENYLLKASVEQVPKMVLYPKDGYWFSFYREQLSMQWKHASPAAHISSGGVIYKYREQQQLVVLLYRETTKSWHLPKGTQVGEETLTETALREVKEETGIDAEIECEVGFLYSTFRRDSSVIFKKTHYFLMSPRSEDLRISDGEHDEVMWKPILEAIELLRETSPDYESQILIKAQELIIGHQ
jgi:8-oxo-dGTP pyrophosphatase MutT (NUDIX family)